MRRSNSHQNQNRQKYIGLQHFASKIAILETSCLWIALAQNEPKSEQPKGAEHVRNNIMQKMWILGVRKALQSIKDNCVTFTKGQNRSDSASDGRYTRIVVRWFNSLYDCCSWLPWLFHWEVWAKERKSMNYMFTSLTLRAVSPEVAPKQKEGVKLRHQSNRIVARSRSHSNLQTQINHCIRQTEQNTKEGCGLIKNTDKPIKVWRLCNKLFHIYFSLE